MKILIVSSGKDIEMLSIMGAVASLGNADQIDMLVPARYRPQMLQLPNIAGVMSLSDFGIQDVFGWRNLPPKVTALLGKSYDKIIDLSISAINPGFAISDSLQKCADTVAAALCEAGLAAKPDIWLGEPVASTLPDNAIVCEPMVLSYWIEANKRELAEFVAIAHSYGMLLVTNSDDYGDLKLNLDLFSYAKVMASAKNLMTFGGVLSESMIEQNKNNVMNWSNRPASVSRQITEVLISIPTTSDLELFLQQTRNVPIKLPNKNIRAKKNPLHPQIYNNLTDQQFIEEQFKSYCCRQGTPLEIAAHVQSLAHLTREEKNQDFAYCDETLRSSRFVGSYLNIPQTQPQPAGLKVAIMLTGHLRTFEKTYPTILKNLILPLSADVFIHTWDKVGSQTGIGHGPIPDEKSAIDENRLRSVIKNIKGLKIESNSVFLQTAKMKGKSAVIYGHKLGPLWYGLSADPIHIESQLYSIATASKMIKAAEAVEGKYDLIIKLRSDAECTVRLPILETTADNNTLWIPDPPYNFHDHPSCTACKIGPHEGEHSADVCDVFAYGSSEAMHHYCSLWDSLEDVWGRCEAENAITFTKPLLHGSVGNHKVVNIWSSPNAQRINCFYPERLFRKHLIGYDLIGSKLVNKIVRPT